MATTVANNRTPIEDDGPNKKQLKKGKTIKFNAQGFVTQQVGKLLEEYAIGDMLGSGGFGEVYLGKHKKSGAERAIKVVHKSAVDEAANQAIIHEFNITRKLDHPNILKMYNLYQDDSYFYIVTDVYKGGELFDEIIKRKKFTEDDSAELMNHLLGCINYCHKQGLVHRDLKPENILLEENMEMDDMKVIDFGLAAPYQDGARLKESVGTVYYMAPEVLRKNYGSKCDVWSCGVICYILLSGFPPFDGETDNDIEKAIKKGDFHFKARVWDGVSDDALDFIQDLLTYESEKRPTAEQALMHPWLSKSRKRVATAYKKRASDSTRQFLSNLKSFNATTKLKQATCSFIASQLLLKQEKEEIDEVFRALDTNCDGKLTQDEVKAGYYDYYGKVLTDDECDRMFQQINYAGTGSISYSEFCVAAMFEKNLLSDNKLLAAFQMFDKDGDGVISVDNFKQVLTFFKDEVEGEDEVDDSYILEIIKQVDSDGDGKVSYADFQEMMFKTVAETEGPPTGPDSSMHVEATNGGQPPKKGHVRRISVLDVRGAETCMALFAEAVAADPEKRHRRNHSHLSHFANLSSEPMDLDWGALTPSKGSHKKNIKSMTALPHVMEEASSRENSRNFSHSDSKSSSRTDSKSADA